MYLLIKLQLVGSVTSAQYKREQTGYQQPCAANTEDPGIGRNHTGNGKRAKPPGSQRSGEEPAIRNTSKNNLVRPPPHREQSRAVFFEADSEHPVHLSQLILRAEDAEENPGPH